MAMGIATTQGVSLERRLASEYPLAGAESPADRDLSLGSRRTLVTAPEEIALQ